MVRGSSFCCGGGSGVADYNCGVVCGCGFVVLALALVLAVALAVALALTLVG